MFGMFWCLAEDVFWLIVDELDAHSVAALRATCHSNWSCMTGERYERLLFKFLKCRANLEGFFPSGLLHGVLSVMGGDEKEWHCMFGIPRVSKCYSYPKHCLRYVIEHDSEGRPSRRICYRQDGQVACMQNYRWKSPNTTDIARRRQVDSARQNFCQNGWKLLHEKPHNHRIVVQPRNADGRLHGTVYFSRCACFAYPCGRPHCAERYRLMSVDYCNGHKHGKLCKYDADGMLKTLMQFEDGHRHGKTLHYEYNCTVEERWERGTLMGVRVRGWPENTF